MRLLVTGAGGMLGRDVCGAAAGEGHDVIAMTHRELDIGDADAVVALVKEVGPDTIINCAAYTNVDGAQGDSDAAMAINGAGAGHVARGAALAGAHLVHVSTDYVFDGTKTTPYVESDPTGPRSVYGASKLAGERAVAAQAPDAHTIVRTSWLFGAGGSCFPKTILRLAGERDELTVVADQVGCPTYTGHLATALLTVADTQPLGVVHVAGRGSCSWHEFAVAIIADAGLTARVMPGHTAELARPAPRPAYSVLGSERPADVPVMPPWQAGLRAFLEAGPALSEEGG